MSSTGPFKDYEGLRLLKQLRNKDIDDFITTTLRCDALEIKHRERFFEKACVPLITDLKLPPDDVQVSVLTTPVRSKDIEVEMTTEVVRWLRSCVGGRFQLERASGKTSTWAGDEVLPDLPHPFKYRKRGDAISIFRE